MTNTKQRAGIPLKRIPWVDMSQFIYGSADEKHAIAMQFGEAFRQIGFAAVTNIGLNPETINQAYAIAEQYFNLPETEKLKQRSPDGHRGFIPFGTEHAKYTDVMDLKEFFQTTGPTQPNELWPDFPGFRQAMTTLYLELETCMRYCLQATAISLGYASIPQQTILSGMLKPGSAVMRILHYPPVDRSISPPGSVRSAPHEDISMMTIIPRATHPGLQVKNHDGEWLDVVVPDGAAIINAGDTLSYITNGMIPSTTHRVINPPENDYSHRYSIPFFGSLPNETVLQVLDHCKGETPVENLPEKITFGEFLHERY